VAIPYCAGQTPANPFCTIEDEAGQRVKPVVWGMLGFPPKRCFGAQVKALEPAVETVLETVLETALDVASARVATKCNQI